MVPFRLSKWYLDCITESGDVTIGYTGVLHWGLVHFGFSSRLESTASNVREQHSLRNHQDPHIKGDSISWKMKRLGIDGDWRSDSLSVRETVFDCEQGSIDWHCLMPRAHAQIGDRRGLGYVELLTMTVPPWKLPIEQLRWGRFLSASDWIVWIDWRGEFSRRTVYRNGEPVAATKLEDWQIEFEGGQLLAMTDSLTLRDGQLGNTALSAIPGVDKTFPGRLLRINECKWRSRARLTRRTGEIVEGWAIHEKVTWPQ